MKKIAIMLANGVEDTEFITVHDILTRAKYNIKTFSIENSKEIKTRNNIKLQADSLYNSINLNEFDLLFIPGGPAINRIEYVEQEKYKKILDFIILSFRDKYIAAICAAPILIANRHILDNTRFTLHPSMEEKIQSIIKRNLVKKSIVLDKKIITGKNMISSLEFSKKIIETLDGNKKAEQVFKEI